MKKQEKIDALKKTLEYVQGDNFGMTKVCVGLCEVAEELYYKDDISFDQEMYVLDLIQSHPKYEYGRYTWKEGAKAPRIKWLKEQIAKLENKKANS